MNALLEQPRLYYRASCAKCRLLSRLFVVLVGGRVRRVPLDGVEARMLHRRLPETRGKLALEVMGGVTTGPRIVLAAVRLLLGM